MRRAAAAVLGIVMIVGVLSGLAVRGTIAHAGEMTVLREIAGATREATGRVYTDHRRWRRALSLFHGDVLSPTADGATFVLVARPAGASVRSVGIHAPQTGRPQ